MGNLIAGAHRPRLVELTRGVADPEGVAAFLGRVLDVVPVRADDGTFGLVCTNGVLTLSADESTPLSIGLAGGPDAAATTDRDGVVLCGLAGPRATEPCGVVLDHVALGCRDLGTTKAFYEGLGFEQTWAEEGGGVHVSGTDGYLSLISAADEGLEPGFIHVGLAVDHLGKVAGRLERAAVPFERATASWIGNRLYLHDTDGARALNVELVEYRDGLAARSGRLP